MTSQEKAQVCAQSFLPSPTSLLLQKVHPIVKSFKFQNCGKSTNPIQVESLTLGPDPLKIPGNITLAVKSSTSQSLTAPIKVFICLLSCSTGETFSVIPATSTPQRGVKNQKILFSATPPPGCTGFDFNHPPSLLMVNQIVFMATIANCKC